MLSQSLWVVDDGNNCVHELHRSSAWQPPLPAAAAGSPEAEQPATEEKTVAKAKADEEQAAVAADAAKKKAVKAKAKAEAAAEVVAATAAAAQTAHEAAFEKATAAKAAAEAAGEAEEEKYAAAVAAEVAAAADEAEDEKAAVAKADAEDVAKAEEEKAAAEATANAEAQKGAAAKAAEEKAAAATSLNTSGWVHSDKGEKHCQPVHSGVIWRARVEGGANAWVGFADERYDPTRGDETSQGCTASVSLTGGASHINPGLSLDGEEHCHSDHLVAYVPKSAQRARDLNSDVDGILILICTDNTIDITKARKLIRIYIYIYISVYGHRHTPSPSEFTSSTLQLSNSESLVIRANLYKSAKSLFSSMIQNLHHYLSHPA
jgi:hypothetical protein